MLLGDDPLRGEPIAELASDGVSSRIAGGVLAMELLKRELPSAVLDPEGVLAVGLLLAMGSKAEIARNVTDIVVNAIESLLRIIPTGNSEQVIEEGARVLHP